MMARRSAVHNNNSKMQSANKKTVSRRSEISSVKQRQKEPKNLAVHKPDQILAVQAMHGRGEVRRVPGRR